MVDCRKRLADQVRERLQDLNVMVLEDIYGILLELSNIDPCKLVLMVDFDWLIWLID